MSQSHNSTDTQALLQSMLQKLKLQPGGEGHTCLNTPLPVTAGERGASNLQGVSNSPVNGFEFGTNGVHSKEFGISAAEFGLEGGEKQQTGHGREGDMGLISFPIQKDNMDGENRVLGQATQPGITPTETGQLCPAQSLKDADITSSERNDGVSFGNSAMARNTFINTDVVTSTGQNQDQGFTPKTYMWSLKPTDANLNTGSKEDKVLLMGNGGFGALAQSKNTPIVPTDQKTTHSSSRRKQQTPATKTRRWTQKIKERWRDRPGSFGKKGKVEDQKSEQETEISPQNQPETLINTPNKEEGKTLRLQDSSDPSKTPPTHTEDSFNEGHIRSTSDFEFGLGSFSLLEEIVTGQEWAKFLNPNPSAASVNQRPSEELKIPPNPHDSGHSSLILNRRGGVNDQWSFRGTEASPGSDFSTAQVSPDAFLPVSMDVSEGKQSQSVPRETYQSEAMEHGHTQSDMQSVECGQRHATPSFLKPADILHNSALKSRVQLSRKRQHQAAAGLHTEETSDAKEADREGSTSSQSLTSSHAMEETAEAQREDLTPLYILNASPPPLSPPPSTPFAPAPKGVLKHSMSLDSESVMEVVTKRRRVEENRRVRFSEEVVTIAPPELDLDATDSEEESEAEEDSVSEQECAVEQAAMEEVAPARRPALPAWIKALKRRNAGWKHK